MFSNSVTEGLLLLRGTCPSSNLRGLHGADVFYSPGHLPTSFDKVFYGSRRGWDDHGDEQQQFSRIDYDTTDSKWVYTSRLSNTTAFSLAEEESYILGKHNWTVRDDDQQCLLAMGKADYIKELNSLLS